jgi:hypothetical protein
VSAHFSKAAVMAGKRKNRIAATFVSIIIGTERKFFRIHPRGDIVIEDAGFSHPVSPPRQVPIPIEPTSDDDVFRDFPDDYYDGDQDWIY